MQLLATARIIFLFVAATYLLSAVLLGWARAHGEAVSLYVIIGWAVTGILGIGLSTLIAPHRPAVWMGLLVALGPWMVYATIGDARERHLFMTCADLAGLGAIAWGLWIAWAQMR